MVASADASTTITIGKLLAAKRGETPLNLKSRVHYRHVLKTTEHHPTLLIHFAVS